MKSESGFHAQKELPLYDFKYCVHVACVFTLN